MIETHVPGINPEDIGESEAAVVRHTAEGSVELVGRITLADWQLLANPGGSTAAVSTDEGTRHGANRGSGQPTHGSADAAANGEPAALPDTHVGHVAREYLSAFNTGDAERMRA